MQFTQPSVLELILNGISFLIILFLGLGIYLNNPKSWTNKFFLSLTIFLDLYTIVNTLSLHPIYHTAQNQLFWIRLDTAIMPLMTLVMFLLCHTFPKKEIRLSKRKLYILVFLALVSSISSLTPYVYQSISYPNGSPVPEPGIMMVLVLGYCLFTIVGSFSILASRYRSQKGIEKVGAKYFLFGMVGTFSAIALFVFIFVIIFKTSVMVFLGPVFPVLLMASIAYSITKYNFLDVKPIIARAVSYILLLVSSFVIYLVVLFFGLNKIFINYVNLKTFLLNALIGIFIAFTFKPLKSLVMRLTDKFLFKNIYDPSKILAELTKNINETINFKDLSDSLLNTIIKELRISKAGIMLISEDGFSDIRSVGFSNLNLLNQVNFLNLIKNNQSFFIVNDLNEDQKKIFKTYDIEAIFPIKSDGKNVAILFLGIKSSGLPYSNQDLDMLSVFASESGVSISNARLYNNLQIALESKNKFIKVVSHQFRTPMSSLKWSIEELKTGGTPKQKKHLLDISYQKIIFLNEQIDDILMVLDINDKKVTLNKDNCDISVIYERTINNLKDQIESNKLNIKYFIQDEVKFFNADFNKISKIFEVLLKNAVLYSESSGEITVNINKGKDNQIFIEVIDNSIGITEEEKSHIFEQFYRSDRAKLKLPDGLGLGMFIAKTFVEYHGGKIKIESRGVDMGTKVQINLPI